MRAVVLIALLGGCRPTPPPNANANANPNENAPRSPTSRTPLPASRPPRIVSISDLPDIHPPSGVTTAALGPRRGGGTIDLPNDLQIVTRCSRTFAWCVDGLDHDGRTIIPAALSFEELNVYDRGDGAWLERVLRVASHDDRFISIYIAESEYSGGAHANNTLACRTYDAFSGNRLAITDLIPHDDAERLLTDLRRSLESDDDDAQLDPAYRLYSIDDDRSFLVVDGEIVVCAEGEYPLASSSILELSLAALPR